jgi:hypothetical protein
MNIIGTVNGLFLYNGYRINRVILPDGKKVYVRDDDHQPVVVLDENDLQTLAVIIDGELKSPWIHE